jgi:hypothetical protein
MDLAFLKGELFGYLFESFDSGDAALAEIDLDGTGKVFFI